MCYLAAGKGMGRMKARRAVIIIPMRCGDLNQTGSRGSGEKRSCYGCAYGLKSLVKN
jgi:hypothetical protein